MKKIIIQISNRVKSVEVNDTDDDTLVSYTIPAYSRIVFEIDDAVPERKLPPIVEERIARKNAAIALAAELHQTGLSLRTIGEKLAEQGYLNQKGRPYAPPEIARFIDRHANRPIRY